MTKAKYVWYERIGDNFYANVVDKKTLDKQYKSFPIYTKEQLDQNCEISTYSGAILVPEEENTVTIEVKIDPSVKVKKNFAKKLVKRLIDIGISDALDTYENTDEEDFEPEVELLATNQVKIKVK